MRVALLLAGDLRGRDLAEQLVGAVGDLHRLQVDRLHLRLAVLRRRRAAAWRPAPCPSVVPSSQSAFSIRWKPPNSLGRDVVLAGVDARVEVAEGLGHRLDPLVGDPRRRVQRLAPWRRRRRRPRRRTGSVAATSSAVFCSRYLRYWAIAASTSGLVCRRRPCRSRSACRLHPRRRCSGGCIRLPRGSARSCRVSPSVRFSFSPRIVSPSSTSSSVTFELPAFSTSKLIGPPAPSRRAGRSRRRSARRPSLGAGGRLVVARSRRRSAKTAQQAGDGERDQRGADGKSVHRAAELLRSAWTMS